MASEAQRRAVKKYEASGKRPGRIITLRIDDALDDAIQGGRRAGESFSGAVKRLIAASLSLDTL